MNRDEFDALPIGSVVYTRDWLGTVQAEYTSRDDGWELTYYDDSIYSLNARGERQIESAEFSVSYLERALVKHQPEPTSVGHLFVTGETSQ